MDEEEEEEEREGEGEREGATVIRNGFWSSSTLHIRLLHFSFRL